MSTQLMPSIRSCAATLAFALMLMACSPVPVGEQDATAKGAQGGAAVARGKVDVEGGLLDITPEVDGVVAHVEVRPGDVVEAGQVLARLDDRGATLEVATARAQVRDAQAREMLLRARLAPAQQLALRWGEAVRSGAAEWQKAQDADDAALQLRGEAEAATAALALSRQRLTQAEWLLSRYTLRAPRRAEVVRVRAQVGARALVEERPLFTLLPATPLVVRAQVSEHFVDRIRIGMAATVSADASGAVYRGKVVRIGRVFLPAETDGEEPVRGARTVECVLALDSSGNGTLRIGQNMLVRFQ